MLKTSTKSKKSTSSRPGPSSLTTMVPSAATRAFAQQIGGSLKTTVLKDAKTGTETKLDASVAALLQRLLADLAAGHAVVAPLKGVASDYSGLRGERVAALKATALKFSQASKRVKATARKSRN